MRRTASHATIGYAKAPLGHTASHIRDVSHQDVAHDFGTCRTRAIEQRLVLSAQSFFKIRSVCDAAADARRDTFATAAG
jgi:hypothetical protein